MEASTATHICLCHFLKLLYACIAPNGFLLATVFDFIEYMITVLVSIVMNSAYYFRVE